MFLVIEIQKDTDGKLSTIVTPQENIRDAKSQHYTILGFAVKSGLPRHGSVILSEDGKVMMSESFTNNDQGNET